MRLALAALLLATPALAAAAPIAVEQPQVRASIGNVPNAAAYMTLRNTGRAPDRLLGASCACAAAVNLHETVQVGGIARMQPIPALTLPPGQSVAFAPGGRHLMLTGVKAPIRAGTAVTIVLRFEKAGATPVTFVATDSPGAPAAHHH